MLGYVRSGNIAKYTLQKNFQHRSDYQLRVAGALRLSTGVVPDSFFESDRTASEAVGSVVYDGI